MMCVLSLQGSNDDFILMSAQSLQDKILSQSSSKERKLSVVLLTDDRNLRVKSYVSGLPVRDFLSFMEWVGPALNK